MDSSGIGQGPATVCSYRKNLKVEIASSYRMEVTLMSLDLVF